jgi:cell shape-determining protein MreD
MSLFLITFLLMIGGAVQTLFSIELPLLLCLMIAITLEADRPHALYAALLAGILHDSLSLAPLGISIPFFVLIAIGLCIIREEIFVDQLITYAILGGITSLLKTFYFAFVFSLGKIRPVRAADLLISLAVGLFAGALLAPGVFLIISPLRRACSPDRHRRAG